MKEQKEYISVRLIKKIYICKNQQELSVLKNINFDIKKGEFICIIGESGCGKSTLLRMMAGLDADYEGDIFIDGEQIRKPSRKRGFVFQEHRLFPWLTVADNIKFVINDKDRIEKQQRVRRVIDIVGLGGFEDAYPKELSGGMAQRANIARELVNNPSILFLDEPFGALDAFTKMRLQNKLIEIREEEKSTMVLVTHDIEEAVFLADRIIVLSNRPATIKDIVEVNIKCPRNRNNDDFIEFRKRLFHYFVKE